MAVLILTIVASALTLAIAIYNKWSSDDANRKKAIQDQSKEINDAVESHDGARIDNAINKLRS